VSTRTASRASVELRMRCNQKCFRRAAEGLSIGCEMWVAGPRRSRLRKIKAPRHQANRFQPSYRRAAVFQETLFRRYVRDPLAFLGRASFHGSADRDSQWGRAFVLP
jgi:hypothetical protein